MQEAIAQGIELHKLNKSAHKDIPNEVSDVAKKTWSRKRVSNEAKEEKPATEKKAKTTKAPAKKATTKAKPKTAKSAEKKEAPAKTVAEEK